MSSMMQDLPDTIDLPGQGGPGGAPGGPPQQGGGSQGGGNPVELLRQALDLVRQAALAEPDDEDQANLEKIGASIAQQIATDQKLRDQATGAGPGAKLVRKVAQGAGGGQ